MTKKNPQREDVESAVAYIVIRKLMRNLKDTSAYKLGLIDSRYKLIREPETEEEEDALSPLNLLVFQIKRVLGPGISRLFAFLYVNNSSEDKYLDSLLTRGMLKNRSDITKVINDLKRF